MRRAAALLAVTAAVAAGVLHLAPAAAAAEPVEPVEYSPPVAGPVVDPFRRPPAPYAAGNRGIDFVAAPGQPVGTAAAGEVTFAGQVGGSLHVVVLHADGLRTSYSFLQSVAVRRGDRVGPGATVGTAGPLVHFGVRAGETYIDPAALFAPAAPLVHLVPVELRTPASEADERGMLAGFLRATGRLAAGAVSVTVDAVDWARDSTVAVVGAVDDVADAVSEHVVAQLEAWAVRLVVLAHYLDALRPERIALATFSAFRAWQNSDCTPGSTAVPPRRRRRIVVLVGGLGSEGGGADVLDVDTAALGYAAGDVAQFSYRGGRVPDVGTLHGVPVNDYDSVDSQGDLRDAGRRLRQLLDDIAGAHPGVPIDVVAHSQGGIVARVALAGPVAAEVENLVTLASPHHGADLATAVALAGSTAAGGLLLAGGSALTDLEPDAPAIAQLAETSPLMAELDDVELPDTVDVTSIAASGDLVAAAPKARLEDATNVILPLVGAFAHGELPGSAGAQREIALAIAGLPPGCRPLWEVARDTLMGSAISHGEDLLGGAVGGALLSADLRVPVRPPATGAAGNRGG